jgi:hypothetical protein
LLLAAGVWRKAAILGKPSGDYHLLAIKKPAWAADERGAWKTPASTMLVVA